MRRAVLRGSPAASCQSGHCAELVAQADATGSAGYTVGRIYNPILAIDANSVYFVSPQDGTLLSSPLATLGNMARGSS